MAGATNENHSHFSILNFNSSALASVPESLKVVLAASRVSPDEAEDAGELTPGKDDNEIWQNSAPQIMPFLGLTEH